MTEQPQGPQSLVSRVTELAATLPATPMELVERIRAIRAEAHVLSPAVTAASIPPHIRINTVVEVIDTTFDPKTGRGNDVYFQASIHKSDRKGYGDDAVYTPLEVSLNATCIKRMLAAAGVSVTHSDQIRTDSQNHWRWQSRGKMRDFDGSFREVPPGTAEIDLRDGSAQIGEWTPEEWAKREAAAAEKAKGLSAKDKWKAKPQPIGGWTADRVMSARRFGLRLAEAKSLNALGRNFGLKQVYSIEELKKPFVIFRATFNYDMSDPDIKKMVTAAELGATNLLGYPAAPALPPASVHESAEPTTAESSEKPIEGEVVSEQHPAEGASKVTDFTDDEPAKDDTKPVKVAHVGQNESQTDFYVTVEGGAVLHTKDRAVAKTCSAAMKAGTAIVIETEGLEILEIGGGGKY